MKAVCWYGREDVRVKRVPDPVLLNPRDAILRVTRTAICGSDLHLYNGFVPSMIPGDIVGHEFTGEVVEVGAEVGNLNRGDRVVVPFPISCGGCFYCQHGMWSLCDNSNPNAPLAEAAYGHSAAGIYGYSHAFGGYAGGQAEYVRVPYADVGPVRIPDRMSEEQAVTLADIFPTGYMAAEQGGIQRGDTVAVWGCGPVGQMAIVSAYLLGARRVIAIDHIEERLDMARDKAGADVINFDGNDVVEMLKQATSGRGPDVCIDAVGMEAHVGSLLEAVDRAKQAVRVVTGRPGAMREAIQACRKGGTVSLAGVYSGFVDTIPFGAAFNKGLTLKMGQAHVHNYVQPLMERIERGEIDPSFVITHRLSLSEAPYGYRVFSDRRDGCVKVVMTP